MTSSHVLLPHSRPFTIHNSLHPQHTHTHTRLWCGSQAEIWQIFQYSELTEIKTFTSINLAQSLHVCKPWCKRVLVWYPLARLHGLKQKYFQHCNVTNCPAPVSKTYRTMTPLCRIEPNREFCEPLHPTIYLFIHSSFSERSFSNSCLKFSFAITGINYILKYCIKKYIYITALLYFKSNKCSVFEHKRRLSNNILLTPNFWTVFYTYL